MAARVFLAFVCLLVLVLGPLGHAMAIRGLDPKADDDKDGLTTVQELTYGTDPTDPDTDGGGAYDGWEVWYETHRATDKNGDPLIAKDYHFDPNVAWDEGVVDMSHDLLLLMDRDASLTINDPDGDGWNNHHEFLVGTDPTNPNTDGDAFIRDSTDPDPLVDNGDGEFSTNCVQDDHPTGHPVESASNSNSAHSGGNGGGGSGVGEAVLMA